MSGTFPGTANAQQHDVNGQPLAGALLTVYQGGSSSALANVFQDIGLTIPASNPLVADASGRIPLFFVADGTYGLRLTDANGIQANGGYFYPSVPSIGASTSGGGGSTVDPTTVFSTGDWKWRPSTDVLSGWVRMNGRTIGNAASGASERANADCQALFIYAWSTYPQTKCAVVGGRGATALADFNAGKQITLLDMRGRSPVGLDDMGNAAAGVLTSGNFPGQAYAPTTAAAYGGEANHTLVAGEIPAITSTVNVSGTLNGTTSSVVESEVGGLSTPGGGFGFSGAGTVGNASVTVSGGLGGASTSNNTGSGAHNNMGPFALGTHYWKL